MLIKPLLAVSLYKCAPVLKDKGHCSLTNYWETQSSTQSSNTTLSKLCTALRLLLVEQHDKHLKALKLLHYSAGNKAGKFLANLFKTKKIQSKVAYLIDQKNKQKYTNKQKIADSFASYYSSLYNLKKDPDTFQPQKSGIEVFLTSLQLPTLMEAQLQALK